MSKYKHIQCDQEAYTLVKNYRQETGVSMAHFVSTLVKEYFNVQEKNKKDKENEKD